MMFFFIKGESDFCSKPAVDVIIRRKLVRYEGTEHEVDWCGFLHQQQSVGERESTGEIQPVLSF